MFEISNDPCLNLTQEGRYLTLCLWPGPPWINLWFSFVQVASVLMFCYEPAL